MNSAPNQILITDVSSYLGAHLAEELLAQGNIVYGLTKESFSSPVLEHQNFTLLELDLSQPLPDYLPEFNTIFDLELLKENNPTNHFAMPQILPSVKNLMNLVRESNKLIIAAPVRTSPDFIDYILEKEQTRTTVVFIGDLYGPDMPLSARDTGGLSKLIRQVIEEDKIIMENEGLKLVYPTYVKDAVQVLKKFSQEHTKSVEFIVSHEAVNELSVSYELQTQASVVLGKGVGLFFSGSEAQIRNHEVHVKIPHLSNSTGLSFTQGLTESLSSTKGELSAQIHTKSHWTPPPTQEITSQPKKGVRLPSIQIPNLEGALALSKKKRVALFLVVVLSLTLAKLGADLTLGARSLHKAEAYTLSGELQKAQKSAQSAQNSFKAAQNKTGILLFPFVKLNIKTATNAQLALSGARDAAESLNYLFQASSGLLQNAQSLTSKEVKASTDISDAQVNLGKSYFLASLSSQKLQAAQNSALVGTFTKSASGEAAKLAQLTASGLDLTYLIPQIIPQNGTKSYLVLLQNNAELRPGGGFIGSYAQVDFDSGKLKNIAVNDVYNADGQLKEQIDPPKQLKEKLGVDKFYLRDSNWNADFPLNAQIARDFYKKETGRDVDGVIAVDLSFFQDFLSKNGPVKLDDYNELITAENIFDKGEYHSEVGFFPGSTQKKDFFSALASKILSRMTTNFNPKTYMAFAQALKDGLATKHVMLTLDDAVAKSYISANNWDNHVPPLAFDITKDTNETRDFFAISEANLGANKVNRLLKRNVNYELTVGRDADLVATLKIAYQNDSQAETWPTGKYVNYLRVYLPKDVDLISYTNGSASDEKDVDIIRALYLSVFATMVEVPIKSAKEVTFTYRIPKNINLEKAPIYHLYAQKQSGTEKDEFRFTINLPAYLGLKSVNGKNAGGAQNYSVVSDLETDRQFKVEIAKK